MENRACPECQKNGHDKDGDHLFLMADGNRWTCQKSDYHPDGKPFYIKVEGNDVEATDVAEVLRRIEESAKGSGSDREGDSGSTDVDTEDTTEDDGGSQVSLDSLISGEKGEKSKAGFTKSSPKVGEVAKKPVIPKVRDSPVLVKYRGISPAVYDYYEVTATYTSTNELTRLSHPIYEVGGTQLCTKYRELPKKFKTYGTSTKGKKVELFGQRVARSSKTLVITEGELDAMSLEEVLRSSKYAKPAVVSLPFGANMKALNDNASFIKKYKKIVVCADGDTAGQKFAKDVATLYPDAMFMDLGSFKDANEMLEAGMSTELLSAYFGAGKYRPPSLCNVKKIAPSIMSPVNMGTLMPWESLNDITYGLSPHSIVSIGAGPSIGKSAWVRGVQQHLMDVHKERIGIFSLEEYQEITLRYLVGYIMGKPIHLPGCIYDADVAEAIALSLEDKAYIYDSSYYNGEWSVIKEAIRYFVSLGVTKIFIDPVSSLVAHIGSSEANTKLGEIMIDMQNLVKEQPITVIMVNHLNSPVTGPSHEEGGRVLPSQFTGSKAQWRYSDLMLGLERDTLNIDPDIKHTLRVRNIKCRMNGSFQGRFVELHYNQITGTLDEPVISY